MDKEQVLHIAASLCRRFEGFYSHPYLCPAGVPTIGYGTTYYEDGTPVQLTDQPITKARANELLAHQLRTVYLRQTVSLCPGADSTAKLAALVDWCYNLGGKALKASTLRRKVNAGEHDEVPDQIRRWNRAGGRVLRGLTIRREAEVAVWCQ